MLPSAAPEELPMVLGALPQLQGPPARHHCEGAAQTAHEQVQGTADFQRRYVVCVFMSV